MASNKNIRFPSNATRQAYYRNRKKILNSFDTCALCGGYVDKDLPKYHPMSAEIDHIVPVSKGGDPAAIENMQLAHRKCNRDKSDKIVEKKTSEEASVNPESWLSWK